MDNSEVMSCLGGGLRSLSVLVLHRFDVFRDHFASGVERGSALTIYYKGEPVCDLWGGYADETILRPWQKDSISVWWSTTKGVSALTLLTLVDK